MRKAWGSVAVGRRREGRRELACRNREGRRKEERMEIRISLSM